MCPATSAAIEPRIGRSVRIVASTWKDVERGAEDDPGTTSGKQQQVAERLASRKR
jgi:hypothetical protein